MGKLTRAEQETIVRWDRSEPVAEVWTADPTTKRRLEKRGHQMVVKGGGWVCRLPLKCISFRRVRQTKVERPGAVPVRPRLST